MHGGSSTITTFNVVIDPLHVMSPSGDNWDMELIWSLGLIVVILLALNHMAGGRASNILGPVANILRWLVFFAFRLCMSGISAILRLLGNSLKLPNSSIKFGDDKQSPGRKPPRWDE